MRHSRPDTQERAQERAQTMTLLREAAAICEESWILAGKVVERTRRKTAEVRDHDRNVMTPRW